MKISNKRLDKGLRSHYFSLKVRTWMLGYTWGLSLSKRTASKLHGLKVDDLHCEEVYIPSSDGSHRIRVRIFKPLNCVTQALPGMLFCHGGGYAFGSPEGAIDSVCGFINKQACVVVAPDYRKSLDAPYPAAFDDCYDTLLWLQENAQSLGVISDQFIVAGQSAGGGLTAAISLKARDTKDVKIAFQMPLYPMIDDRKMSRSPQLTNTLGWNSRTNHLAWRLYLSDLFLTDISGSNVPYYAAPSRAKDLSELPPMISFVGDLDPFLDENITFVENLRKSGVPVEFKIYSGCFHSFDTIAPEAQISKKANEFLLEKFSEYMKAYFH